MSRTPEDSHTPDFLTHFQAIEDPRQEAKVSYPLDEILLLVLCAVISGADGWTSVALYGEKKLELLRRFLSFENGTPCHDQLGILFSRLDMEAFQSCFISWISSLNEMFGGVVAVDGKTLRRSFDTGSGKAAIHMVSAWACDQQLVLGQRKVDDKSNEITAIPELLELLALKGAIVTIDAMGCQRKICQQIIDQEADYVIGLKGNQGSLHEDVELFFDEHLERDIGGDFVKQRQTVDADHGRIETRRCTVCTDIGWLDKRHHWPGMKAVIMTQYTREIRGETETIRRFYIASFADSPEKMARCIRDHWQVENCLHWVLDVTFGQDDCRIRKANSAANFATINHAAINLLKRFPGKKMSLPQKRRSAAWDDDYMEAIIRQ
ncbi:ISAs1 family transposase [Hoeflea sp.]|uniref:ISAs1 family transposase n=1 Tax=Hoeflea sp. TaxID=1940281 RepID=UPI003B01E821